MRRKREKDLSWTEEKRVSRRVVIALPWERASSSEKITVRAGKKEPETDRATPARGDLAPHADGGILLE